MQQESSTSVVSLSRYFVILKNVRARGVVDWQRKERKVLSSVMVSGVRDWKLPSLWNFLWVTDGRVTHLLLSPVEEGWALPYRGK